jgi:hypothetical protein
MLIKIPFALDLYDQLIGIKDAQKGGKYFCPSCRASVIVRKGEIKIHHFAHKANNICSQETAVHKIAKMLVRQRFTAWKAGLAKAPVMKRACQVCGGKIDQAFPDKVESAELEVGLSNGSIADVALLAQGKPIAVIEIRVTHAVDEQKATTLPVPFIEIDGYKVLEQSECYEPLLDSFLPFSCASCKAHLPLFINKSKQIARATQVVLPESYYRYAPTNCWKCGKEIIVFSWPDHDNQDDNSPKKHPIPTTILFRNSKMAGTSYWLNICPYCKNNQGDFFLYSEPDGPFFGFDCGDETPEGYTLDLMRLAYYDTMR